MEEEGIEEGAGQEELVEEEEAEVESVKCAPTRTSGQSTRHQDQDTCQYNSKGVGKSSLHVATSLSIEIDIHVLSLGNLNTL